MVSKQTKKEKGVASAAGSLPLLIAAGALLAGFAGVYAVSATGFFAVGYDAGPLRHASPPTLDKIAYDAKLLFLAHADIASTTATTTAAYERMASTTLTASKQLASSTSLWPAKAAYPNYGALLPFNRIVAYYGNFYSKQMGVLGQYPEDEVLARLKSAADEWRAADPSTPVIPAVDYIAVTAQGSAGADGKYRLRMPDSQIDQALEMAEQVHGVVFLDIQVGLSNVETEVPLLEKYLELPNVHLALDPEFAMHGGAKPGTVIGSLDAKDINFAAQYLAALVREHHLPPKILVIHRFTEDMVTNYRNIEPLPEVEIVMDMDGWGDPAKKIGTFTRVVQGEPVQFAGFKLFYKNDLKPPSTRLLSPEEVLKLTPSPVYIQYQ